MMAFQQLSRHAVLSLLLLAALFARPVDSSAPARFTTKKYKVVNGRRMAYVEVGKGDPIVFLHGNPTSSYLWRNIMPYVEGRGRLIAPDLIGMGDSEKLPAGDPSRYSLLEHSNYLFRLLEQLNVKRHVTFVIHDWGSALGFMWAYKNRFDPQAVRGLAFMEMVVAPFGGPYGFPFDTFARDFGVFKLPIGEDIILRQNLFIEQFLPGGILRNLTSAEFDEYRRPWTTPGESRRPMLSWPREIPINGDPKEVRDIIVQYAGWVKNSRVPKLFIRAEPGVIIRGSFVDIVRKWRNVKEVVVKGLHFVQEDSPDEIGQAVANWLPKKMNGA